MPSYSLADLTRLDLGPLRVDAVAEDASDVGALVALRWGAERVTFAVALRQARSLRDLRNAAWHLRDIVEDDPTLLVVPYLSDDALAFLQEEGMNALDLSGNGLIEVPGRWRFFQRGFASRFPTQRVSRAPYRGKSALVGRVLLARPRYATIGDVENEIKRRGGRLSYSQISKVLFALEDDLIVRKEPEGVRESITLLQPKKLLDALVAGYDRPEPLQTLQAKADLGPGLYKRLRARAEHAGARIAAFEPQRYAVAPTSRAQLEVYVEPTIGSDLSAAFDLQPVSRFENVIIRVVDELGVYFDLREADGFPWCPPLEVYLQLMQGGKREQEIAAQLRDELLGDAS